MKINTDNEMGIEIIIFIYIVVLLPADQVKTIKKDFCFDFK